MTACEAVESLSSKEEPSCEEKAFLLLYSNLGLQLLSPSEREGTTHSIEVNTCVAIICLKFVESQCNILFC